MSLQKNYDPNKLEQHWYEYWEKNGYFSPSKDGESSYCIMIPPPNVTGLLHMGHAFQDTIMDALIRYHRMLGDNTLWQAGTDHAGIATQMVVERLINAEGKTRHDYGRDKFIERVWQWRKQSGGMITRQLRRMGASPDWDNERFTMDDGLSEAVQTVFIRLYDEGLIYRGKRLVNWDPTLHTALSDLEVLPSEEKGHMWHIRYPLSDEDGYLTVATTRPETLFGDSAVAFHPGDERYQRLIGKMVELPLTGRTIPVIADEHADPEFGSGCVKITPAHDFNDYQVWLRHRDSKLMQQQPLEGLINIFTIDAAIRDNGQDEGELIPTAYVGLDRYAARKKAVEELQLGSYIVKTEDHKLMIPRGDRSGAVVEPFLTDQWYVDLTRDEQPDGRPGGKQAIVTPAINAVRDGRVRFVPDNWSKTYFQWLQNIEDWCISRQIWWGHRIPAWYDDQDNIYVGESEETVRAKYKLADNLQLRQDEDVLDTWFSSALWPFSTLGWPHENERLSNFYPTSVLVTGFDIIFFWVARMIMMGVKFADDVPFHDVYIHGLVRDAHGQKMSKSIGNVLDPIDIIDGIELEDLVAKRLSGMMQPHRAQKIEKQTRKDYPNGIASYGTDALRFTFAALATTGRDINFDLGRTEGYRNFCNKIWNAARFVLMNCEGQACGQLGTTTLELSVVDRWIISTLQKTEAAVSDAIDRYRLDQAAREIHEFTWHNYCDWYIEFCKPVLTDESSSKSAKRAARGTLVRVLETLLRLMHPIMPFISEEIWQQVAPLAGKQGDTIMTQPYPVSEEGRIDEDAEREIGWLMQFVQGIRQIKGEMNIAPGKRVPVLLMNAYERDRELVDKYHHMLDFMGRLESIEELEDEQSAPESATVLVGELKILIPMADLIDKSAEIHRLEKEIARLMKDISRIEGKLNNKNFTERAPANIVASESEKLAQARIRLSGLSEQLKKIKSL